MFQELYSALWSRNRALVTDKLWQIHFDLCLANSNSSFHNIVYVLDLIIESSLQDAENKCNNFLANLVYTH